MAENENVEKVMVDGETSDEDELVSISDDTKTEVTLINKFPELQGFGLDISGGTDRPYFDEDCGIFVSALRTNGLAEKSGQINIDDKIIEVNGVNVENVTHSRAVQLFTDNKREVKLRLHKNYALLLRAASVTPSSSQTPSPDSGKASPRRNNNALTESRSSFSIPGFVLGIALGCVSVLLFKRYIFQQKS